MEINPTLLEEVRQNIPKFGTLYDEHFSLKLKVEALNKKKLITPEQELEKKEHQKRKLVLKDQMEKMLSQYQGNSSK